jgi:hypothetical protein
VRVERQDKTGDSSIAMALTVIHDRAGEELRRRAAVPRQRRRRRAAVPLPLHAELVVAMVHPLPVPVPQRDLPVAVPLLLLHRRAVPGRRRRLPAGRREERPHCRRPRRLRGVNDERDLLLRLLPRAAAAVARAAPLRRRVHAQRAPTHVRRRGQLAGSNFPGRRAPLAARFRSVVWGGGGCFCACRRRANAAAARASC